MGETDHREDQPGQNLFVCLPTRLPARPLLTERNRKNLAVGNSPDRVEPRSIQVPPHEDLPPAPIDGIYDKWFFISGAAV